MALFMSGEAFANEPELMAEAKLGALLTMLVALVVVTCLGPRFARKTAAGGGPARPKGAFDEMGEGESEGGGGGNGGGSGGGMDGHGAGGERPKTPNPDAEDECLEDVVVADIRRALSLIHTVERAGERRLEMKKNRSDGNLSMVRNWSFTCLASAAGKQAASGSSGEEDAQDAAPVVLAVGAPSACSTPSPPPGGV